MIFIVYVNDQISISDGGDGDGDGAIMKLSFQEASMINECVQASDYHYTHIKTKFQTPNKHINAHQMKLMSTHMFDIWDQDKVGRH